MKALVLLVGLAGCAASTVSSNAAGGIIQAGFTPDGWSKAAAAAEAGCQKHGKISIVKSRNMIDNTLRYECVVP